MVEVDMRAFVADGKPRTRHPGSTEGTDTPQH